MSDRAGETAVSEDPGSVSSIYVRGLTVLFNSMSMASSALFWPLQCTYTRAGKTPTHITKK